MLLKIRQALTCVLLLVLIVVGIYAAGFVLAATVTVASGPKELQATRAELARQVAAGRDDALKEIDNQANALRGELHGDFRVANAQITAVSGMVNQRVGDTLGRVDTALATVEALRTDLHPALAGIPPALKSIDAAAQNAGALVKDAQDSWDSNYDDVVSLLDSSEVAVTQTAQTLQTINKNAGPALETEQKTATSVAGITVDVHAMTTAALKPKSFFGKVWAGITVASRFAGLL